MSQSWKVALTPRQRWEILQWTFGQGVTFKGREDQRRLYRMRQAFGILAASEMLVSKQRVNGKLIQDNEKLATFDVTAENVETLLKILDKIEPVGFQLVLLEPLLQTLEDLKDNKITADPRAEGVAPFDQLSEDWRPSPIPPLPGAGVENFPEALVALINGAADWVAFKKAIVEAWTQVKEQIPGEPESK